MQLTTFSDYSLRVLMYVGVKGETLSRKDDIATAYNISRNHLMKIIQTLGEAGFLETIRGKNGGIRLGRPPSELVLGEILRHTEKNLYLVPCFEPGVSECVISGPCRLKGVLGQALEGFFKVLDDYTLADLLQPAPALAKSLGLGTVPTANHP